MIKELTNQRKYLELIYSAVINKNVTKSWAGVFGHPSWKVNYV